jgi:hypothetical protein
MEVALGLAFGGLSVLGAVWLWRRDGPWWERFRFREQGLHAIPAFVGGGLAVFATAYLVSLIASLFGPAGLVVVAAFVVALGLFGSVALFRRPKILVPPGARWEP